MTERDEANYHYNVIGRAIEIIDAAGGDPLPLEGLAAKLSMSPGHFQRVFSQWVGVSPKRYQQYLTLNHAKQMLADRHTVLDTALDTGLSGTGRLHDLFIRWEAMSPGEFARGGEGLTLNYGWFETPFGDSLAIATDKGLAGLAFASVTGPDHAFEDMRSRWPLATYMNRPDLVAPHMEAALKGQGALDLHLIGAPFQIKVWEALLQIPEGAVTTYSDVAARIGKPDAVRAVGTAVGRNPISWLIPCHRVLRKSGGLGGYHWGLPVKRAMLAYEAARTEERVA